MSQPGGVVQLFDNPEQILKTLQANQDFSSGGSLDEEQQRDLFSIIRAFGVMLAPIYPDLDQFPPNSPIGRSRQATRFSAQSSVGGGSTLVPGGARWLNHTSGATAGTYDQMYAGEPITRGATEATEDADQYVDNPVKFGRRRFENEKLRSSWKASTEFYVESIIGNRLDMAVQNALAPRLMHDYEDLAINGDDAIVGLDKRSRLLNQNDGWVKITEAQCPQFSAGGDFIEWDVFVRMVKMIPDHYAMNGELRWWANPHLWLDWLQFLQNQTPDAVAAGAMGGNGLAPMGMPMVLVPLIPRQRAIANVANVVGRVLGNRSGPFAFTAAANSFSLNVDAVGATVITLTSVADPNEENRILTAERVAKAINDQYSAARGTQFSEVAQVDQHGQLELRSAATGVAGSVVLVDTEVGTLATMGLAAGASPGAALGNQYQGTILWLSPSFNFVWHTTTAPPQSSTNGLRMFTKFEQEEDAIKTDVYTWQDATIEDPTATILATDIAVARPDEVALNP